MRTHRHSRIGFPRAARLAAACAPALFGLVLVGGEARAQIAGVTTRPIPNVLLLVDNSGSMERMPDNSLPSQNRDPVTGLSTATNACTPGTASNPNRWGMLLQALTGNMQPYYSCEAIDRAGAAFKNEFKIAGVDPYDADYFLPYHRPLTGASAATACTIAPYNLGGATSGQGIGPSGRGAGGDSRDFPPDALAAVRNQYLAGQYAANSPITLAGNTCVFDQANDGQLDATRDFIRFALMTFDNDTSPALGVVTANPPSGVINTADPFLGQWSYVKSPTNPLSLGVGLPAGCTTGTTPFEVGARHWAAPVWEGRMVPFADPNGTIYDLQRTNEQIQQVLLATRPYGATPIDGMMEDARDYLWHNEYGPLGTQPGYADPYVDSGCRDQNIILLTDGAPNLDMRPACEGAGPPAGQCPYPNKAAQVADQLHTAIGNRKVTTYVIGFSVNGAGNTTFTNDGFPGTQAPPNNNCKAWYNTVGGTPAAMRSECLSVNPPAGSTADACCKLNEIAYYGSGGTVGPFFAETQADLVLSFGRILGGVARSATTRTLPGYAPAISYSNQTRTADFIASFIPNALKVWSGEIDRTRSYCVGPTPIPQLPQSPVQGDSYAANTAAQSVSGKRLFITAKGTLSGGFIDSARTMRPYTSATAYTDGIPDYIGAEIAGQDMALAGQANWAEALDIDDSTCKRSRAPQPGAPSVTVTVPALGKNDCTDVIWGFATAHYSGNGSLVKGTPAYDFNVRCTGSGGLAAGFCSISGGACTVGGAACPTPGEVCVPECAALGAVYRSSPTIVGPPDAFVRDEGYRVFAEQRARRRPTMYVATSDGVLHAFKALAAQDFDPGDHELWAFVPPAVLPKLASNYPTGQQILLDGTPTVRDVVWERQTADFADPTKWHTTLVAGMGAGGPGYYALNVTDTDCGGTTNASACLGGGSLVSASSFNQASGPGGPHFLWQLTDIEYFGAGDPAKPTRVARDGTQMVALFGRESGTPAIATLEVDPDGNGKRQIGVAILPGGIDGPPVKNGSTIGTCLRGMDGGAATAYSAVDFDFSDGTLRRRNSVRQWGTPCNTGPVPGRGVTIVRLDTGEVLRHFGRRAQDVPRRLWPVTNDTPFDSPIIGKPVVYPDLVGATAQKVFVGDADGTVWRIDLSSVNPANWKATLFQDLVSADLPTSPGPLQSQPIAVPLLLSLDQAGGVVINAATGDQENLVASATERNYVYSIQETRAITAGVPGRAQVRWFYELGSAERVTGPMVVFDRTLYFATYRPAVPASGACTNGGTPLLWGMDFYNADTGGVASGGIPRWCPIGNVDPISGACTTGLTRNQDPTGVYPSLVGAIIPGVTIRASLPCATFGAVGDDPAGITAMTSTKYELFFGATSNRSGASGLGTPQAERTPITRPLPRTPASIDAWAFVID